MLTAAHEVLLGEDVDAQACVAAALPPVALGRLRRTCRGARGATPVGVDWAQLYQPSELAATGKLRALKYLYQHDEEDLDMWDTLVTAADRGRHEVVAWVLGLTRVAPNVLLHVAASASTPEVLRLLSAAGLEHSPTALLTAVQCGNVAFLNAVLDAGVHPDSEFSLHDVRYGAHRHALISACNSGHLPCARALLAAGADVDGQGREGSALAEAAREGHLECMRLLLDNNADVDRQGQNGSALLGAAREGHLECMQLLLEHSADVNAWDRAGCTALMYATSARQIECVRLLLENTADVNARSKWGRTALNFSKGSFSMSYLESDQTACTLLLLEAGADVNAADNDGNTAIMHAALYGNRSLTPLLKAGADVHAANANGFTPMLSACRSGYMENVLLLDGRGADPHAVSADGTTALMLACMRGHEGDVARWLIDKNVDLDAVQRASQNGDAGHTALIISSGDRRRMLVEVGTDLNVTDTQGWTALMHDCDNRNINAVRELIAAGASTWESSEEGKCAMDLAAEGGHWDCVTAVSQAREKFQRA